MDTTSSLYDQRANYADTQIYDKGIYSIKITGPEGWAFERSQITVTVGNEACNHNFELTGFRVEGEVKDSKVFFKLYFRFYQPLPVDQAFQAESRPP